MQIRVFDSQSDHQTTNEHDDSLRKVIHCDLSGVHDAQKWESYYGDQRCHR